MGIATALPTESRCAPRRGLFMSAIVFADGRSWPIRIRNLSASGAMIEGIRLPESGSVQLCRADHHVVASIVWGSGKRRGLKFHGSIAMDEWVPVTLNGAQDALDQRILRARMTAGDTVTVHDASLPVIARVGEELKLASRRLEATLDELGDFAPLVQRNPTELVQLEVLQQLLEKLADVVQADDPVAAAEKIGMDDVRRRLLR